jgi:hypothetical protein
MLFVEVYRNLNKGGYSVRSTITKKVIMHVKSIHLSNVTFHVQQGGRNRVLRTKQKNVHAFIRGTIDSLSQNFDDKIAYYNPYLTETFIDKATKQSLTRANAVICDFDYNVYYKL